MASRGLELGVNTLIFFERRTDWKNHNPGDKGWQPAVRRTAPLGGQYVARISATTATDDGDRIIQGFTTTLIKGAGIRVYEYASRSTIASCRLQLEALYWLCGDALEYPRNNRGRQGVAHDAPRLSSWARCVIRSASDGSSLRPVRRSWMYA